ncbi:MAG: class I SAM-dependent methyltransferase [Pyrinomonadaceae bacterium]
MKNQKELAFVREHFVKDEWTRRFTDLIDKHVKFPDEGKMLYINAGTGDHAIALSERIGAKADIFAACEDEDVLAIARDKAAALRSAVDFSMVRFENEVFDVVVADAGFVEPIDIAEISAEAVRVSKSSGRIAILLMTAGSFGEIFSLLWEVLVNLDLGGHGELAEKMINEIPSVSDAEEMARAAGLVNVKSHTSTEIFEYENGSAFIDSPLIADFLLPMWLEFLDDNEMEQVSRELTHLIDAEDGTLTLRFSVKATLLTGEKG